MDIRELILIYCIKDKLSRSIKRFDKDVEKIDEKSLFLLNFLQYKFGANRFKLVFFDKTKGVQEGLVLGFSDIPVIYLKISERIKDIETESFYFDVFGSDIATRINLYKNFEFVITSTEAISSKYIDFSSYCSENIPENFLKIIIKSMVIGLRDIRSDNIVIDLSNKIPKAILVDAKPEKISSAISLNGIEKELFKAIPIKTYGVLFGNDKVDSPSLHTENSFFDQKESFVSNIFDLFLAIQSIHKDNPKNIFFPSAIFDIENDNMRKFLNKLSKTDDIENIIIYYFNIITGELMKYDGNKDEKLIIRESLENLLVINRISSEFFGKAIITEIIKTDVNRKIIEIDKELLQDIDGKYIELQSQLPKTSFKGYSVTPDCTEGDVTDLDDTHDSIDREYKLQILKNVHKVEQGIVIL